MCEHCEGDLEPCAKCWQRATLYPWSCESFLRVRVDPKITRLKISVFDSLNVGSSCSTSTSL